MAYPVKRGAQIPPEKPIALLNFNGGRIRSTRHFYLSGDRPHEIGQFPGHRHADFVVRNLPDLERPVASTQSYLGLPGNLAYRLRLTFLANLNRPTDAGRETVAPGCLHQDLPA